MNESLGEPDLGKWIWGHLLWDVCSSRFAMACSQVPPALVLFLQGTMPPLGLGPEPEDTVTAEV